MSTFFARWTRLMPETLTPAQVDADLRRAGLDPQEVRGLIKTLSQDLGVAFAAGVLAGLRFGLVCAPGLGAGTRRRERGSGRVIPFPGPGDRRTPRPAARQPLAFNSPQSGATKNLRGLATRSARS